MRIKSIQLRDYKRFHDLRIFPIPETTRLVVVAGPNGFGKSSLFDGFLTYHRSRAGGLHWDPNYHLRSEQSQSNAGNAVSVEFHEGSSLSADAIPRMFYIRTAYRNDPHLNVNSLSRQGPAVSEMRFNRLTETDAAVSKNYSRLFGNVVEDVLSRGRPDTTLQEYRHSLVGEISCSLNELFPGLALYDLGNPFSSGTFRFQKGTTKGFRYENLSGGERNAFDLLLDVIVKRVEFSDSIYCFDEPDAHMNANVHGKLLDALLSVVPDPCQIWIATHAIGMMRRAIEIERANPGSVTFLDFGNKNFDEPVTMIPTKPTRLFWIDSLRVALDDLAGLVAPHEIIICEGSAVGKNYDHDARCYNAIFQSEFPEVQFISGGGSSDVSADRFRFIELLPKLVSGVKVRRLVDRDDRSATEIADLQTDSVSVLSSRNLQSYLWSQEVLDQLCRSLGCEAKIGEVASARKAALVSSIARGNPADDLKSAAGELHVALKKILPLTGLGNDARSFERDTLAPLIQPALEAYQEVRRIIFPRSGVVPF